MKFSDMQLLHKMVNEGVTQQRVLEYFRKEGYSESEVLDELVSYERELESKQALSAPALDPTKPLPPKPKTTTKELAHYDRRTMLDMWKRGESEEAIKALFVMKGFDREYIVQELEDIKLNPQLDEKEHVGVIRSLAPEVPETEISQAKPGGVSKPFVFAVIMLVALGALVVTLYFFAPDALEFENWFVAQRSDQYIIAITQQCPTASGDAVVEIALGEARQIVNREILVKETNVSCGSVYLYTRFDAVNITCPGPFSAGEVYTLHGDHIADTKFKCQDFSGGAKAGVSTGVGNGVTLNFGI
jgi:hypothetical protein